MVNSMSIYFQLFLASFFWGSNVIVMKLLLNQLPFLFLAFLRVLLSFLFLGLYICFTHIPLHCPNKKKLIIIALLSIYLNFYFTFLGMNQVKGVDNAFMNALSPTVTFLLSFLFLRNHYTFKEWIAMFLSLFAFLLSTFGEGQELLIAVTHMAESLPLTRYISQYGCDDFEYWSQRLLLDDRGEVLRGRPHSKGALS